MRQFDLNEFEIEHLEDIRLNDYLVSDVESLFSMVDDEWPDLTDDEYEAALTAQTLTLKRVNEILRERGIHMEFCEVDTVDTVDFILVNRGETEAEFADRVFGQIEVDFCDCRAYYIHILNKRGQYYV